MDPQSQLELGPPPGFGSKNDRIRTQEIVSKLRTVREDFDKLEEVLLSKEEIINQEIAQLQEKLLMEKVAKFNAEVEFRKREEMCENGKKTIQEAHEREIAELRKKNAELEGEVCELRKLKQKWVDDRNDLVRYRSRVRELENDKNVLAALKVENSELKEAVKRNLATINEMSNEICTLLDTELLMSVCSGGGNNADVGVTTFQDTNEELENHNVELGSLPRNESTHHSLEGARKDAQGASSDMEILHKDAQGALSGMAKTRGGGLYRPRPCDERPTTSVRYKRARGQTTSIVEEAPHVRTSTSRPSTSQPLAEPEPKLDPQPSVAPTDRSSAFPYPGGPDDGSVLYSYGSHIARDIWDGLERPLDGQKQRLFNHSMKEIEIHPMIHEYILQSGLLPLQDVGFNAVNNFLATAFVERWHGETNTFHLPVGEMTITLDDVAQLLHIPITGAFYDLVEPSSKMEAAQWLVHYLGVDYEEAAGAMPSKGYLRFGWLESVYKRATEGQRWEDAARCYLLLLLGRTIFSDKSGNRVKVAFLYMIRDLGTAGQYCWGAMALAHLYKQLTKASSPSVSQIGGYGTLLQAWIFEHFQGQTFGTKWIDDKYDEEEPRAKRWECKRADGNVAGYRAALDHLVSEQVTWMPYANPHHRDVERLTYFKGYVRHARSMLAYNPDRVVRQFGWIQGIPQDPRPSGRPVVTKEANDLAWINFNFNLIPECAPVLDGRPATAQGYMVWFRKVSHPYLMPENYPFGNIYHRRDMHTQ